MEQTLSVKQAFQWGWETFKKYWALVIGLILAAMVIPSILSYIFDEISRSIGPAGVYDLLVIVFLYALNILISIGLIVAAFKFYDNAKPRFADLFTHTKYVWKYFLGSIAAFFYIAWPLIAGFLVSLILLAIGVGAAFLSTGPAGELNIEQMISAGGPYVVIAVILTLAGFIYTVYLSLKYLFWNYSLVDRGLGPIDSLRRSGEITANQRAQILVFLLAAAGLNILGVIALLVGLLITVPVTWLAMVHVYRQLSPSEQTVINEGSTIPQESQQADLPAGGQEGQTSEPEQIPEESSEEKPEQTMT